MMKLNSWLNDQVFVGVTLNGNVTENKGFHSSVNPNQYAYETSRTIPCYNEDGSLFYYETRQKDNLQVVRLPKKKCYIILYMSWDKQDLREKLRV